MTREERIYAELTDGTTEEVSILLDPDKHPSAYVRNTVRELVRRQRGFLPDGVRVDRFSFDPLY